MAKILRKTQKIFCSNPNVTNQTAVFGTMKDTPSYSSDVETLQSNEAYEQGWNSAVTAGYAPFMEDMNTAQYIQTSQIAYLLQQGIPEWDDGTTYYTNSYCQVAGAIYKSTADNNLNNNPSTDGGVHWQDFATSIVTPLISTIVGSIYKVGDLFITTNTSTTCPIASLIPGSTWELVAQDRCLQGADSAGNAGQTVAAGLPNITGHLIGSEDRGTTDAGTSGALFWSQTNIKFSSATQAGGAVGGVAINAGLASSIYGNSQTVQPPALKVNVWKRTA